MKLTKKLRKQIQNIADTLCYGLEWIFDEEEKADTRLALETLGHVGACRISTEITGDTVFTSEIRDLLVDNPPRKELDKRLTEYILA